MSIEMNDIQHQGRNETNLQYIQRIEVVTRQKEEKKRKDVIEQMTAKVLNQPTTRTSLHGASKSIFAESQTKSAREVMERTQLEFEAKRLFGATIHDTETGALRNLINELTKVEERIAEKKKFKMTKRPRFIPFNPTTCVE